MLGMLGTHSFRGRGESLPIENLSFAVQQIVALRVGHSPRPGLASFDNSSWVIASASGSSLESSLSIIRHGPGKTVVRSFGIGDGFSYCYWRLIPESEAGFGGKDQTTEGGRN